ncbi:MAG: small multi-drug export protein [Candidatus Brocadiia bacterium]
MSIFSATPRSHRGIFLAGCALLAVEGTALLVLTALRPVWAAKVCGVIATTGVGGQAGAIIAGLELGFSPWQLGGLLAAFNVMHVCLFFPMITTLYHTCMEMPVIGRWVAATHRAAERQMDEVTRLGSFGLPIFVWLPFPWTGTLVGAVIGYMLGMRTGRVMLMAIPAMLVSVVTWVSAVNYLRLFASIEGWTTVVVLLVLVGAFTAVRLLKESRRGEEE